MQQSSSIASAKNHLKPLGRKLRTGEWVEVLSKAEILETLDDNGRLDGMPFMPEMFAFCGRRFKVAARAHKTCDTVFPARGLRVHRSVHLDTRCDGQAHGGCQAGCLIFWKEAWLKPVSGDSAGPVPVKLDQLLVDITAISSASGKESLVWLGTQKSDHKEGPIAYSCQATQLPYASSKLPWWDMTQYMEDYTSGNVGLSRLLNGFFYAMYYNLTESRFGLRPVMIWLYDRLHPLWGGTTYPRKKGTIPVGDPTPAAKLDLQPGEMVRVKSHDEILRTLNTDSKNRGMGWDAELVPYTGGTFKVLKRVTHIVDEKTGHMQEMKTPCIILDSVVCKSRFSYCRMFCPRSIYPYWREIWLERVERKPVASATSREDRVSIESTR